MFYRLLPTLFGLAFAALVLGYITVSVLLPAYKATVHTLDSVSVSRTLGQAATTR
jgi:hypothetical protein